MPAYAHLSTIYSTNKCFNNFASAKVPQGDRAESSIGPHEGLRLPLHAMSGPLQVCVVHRRSRPGGRLRAASRVVKRPQTGPALRDDGGI